MKICIDAGHGGSDAGAVNGNYYEKTPALVMAKLLGDKLKASGADIIYTRVDDRDVELKERTDYANANKADYFISIHLNSATAKSANGIETFAYNTSGVSWQLANAVQKSLIEYTNATDRGARTANYHVLRETTMPAILVEAGFFSNDNEVVKLFDKNYQNVIVTAIAKAVANFLGLKEVESMEKRYNHLNEIPAGEFRETISELMEKGIIKGGKDGKLNLSHDMVRMFVINNRAGAYK